LKIEKKIEKKKIVRKENMEKKKEKEGKENLEIMNGIITENIDVLIYGSCAEKLIQRVMRKGERGGIQQQKKYQTKFYPTFSKEKEKEYSRNLKKLQGIKVSSSEEVAKQRDKIEDFPCFSFYDIRRYNTIISGKNL